MPYAVVLWPGFCYFWHAHHERQLYARCNLRVHGTLIHKRAAANCDTDWCSECARLGTMGP